MQNLIIGRGALAITTDLPAGLPVPTMVCWRPSGGVISTNLAARELFHWHLGEVIPADWSLWNRFADPDLCRDLLDRLETGDQINHLEAALHRQDGETVWVLISARTSWHAGEPTVVVTFGDITDLKQREVTQAQALAQARSAAQVQAEALAQLQAEAEEIQAQETQTSTATQATATQTASETSSLETNSLADTIRDLEAERDRAEAASQAKSAFLTEMSHELRSPLNAILGFSEIIRDRHFGDQAVERYADYAGLVHTAGSHLLALINDILDLSKIESGKLTLNPEPLDPAPLLRECAELILPVVTRREQTIDLMLEPALTLQADARRMKQMVLNLLSNAAKFTPAGGHIRLSVRRLDETCLAVLVSDNGVGMTSADITLALQPFGQIQQRNIPDIDSGTGLGLPIVKSLVELHGGRFVIDSAQERGTTIALVFPSPVSPDLA